MSKVDELREAFELDFMAGPAYAAPEFAGRLHNLIEAAWNEGWNEAIEVAALRVEQQLAAPGLDEWDANVRTLKKGTP